MHIGFAADTPNGLVVPVVHDADRKDIYEIARAARRAVREGARRQARRRATCRAAASRSRASAASAARPSRPIINAPEVAILGVSRSSMQPVYQDGGFVPRLMLPLSLSYDHRVIDGAMAARFTTFLAQTLAEPRALIEAVP